MYVSSILMFILLCKNGDYIVTYKNGKFEDFNEYNKYKHLGLVYPYMCIFCDNLNVEKPALLMLSYDSKFRLQYRYNEYHIRKSQENKIVYVKLMIRELENAVIQIARDLSSIDEFTCLLAMMAFITMKTGIRIGKDVHMRLYNSIGLSTLMKRNVTCNDKTCNFNFIGKKGVSYTYTIDDHRCVAILKRRLAKCKHETDFIFSTTERKITYTDFNAYVKTIFKNERVAGKDFRTLLANVSFLDHYINLTKSSSRMTSDTKIKESIRHVASVLQNTRAVSKKSYIFEKIIEYIKKNDKDVHTCKNVTDLMIKIFIQE